MTPGVAPEELERLEILGALPRDVRARIAASCDVADHAAGEIILARGEENRALRFVLSGEAHVAFELARQVDPIRLRPGSVFGELSVIDGRPVSAFVVASVPSRVLSLAEDAFWSEVSAAPGAARGVMRALTAKIRANADALTRRAQEQARYAGLERELAMARDVQTGMLRRPDPWFPERRDVALAAFCQPARQVGGDFYDAFLLDADRLAVLIGDVAGKGIAAALFMVRALTLLRAKAMSWTSLPETLQHVNRALADGNEASLFLTLFMGVLDLRTGAMETMNWGHLPPLLARADGSASFIPVRPGFILGVMEQAKGASGRIDLAPGDSILLYTDGVTEAEDPERRPFRPESLLAAAASAAWGGAEALTDGVAGAVLRHAAGAEPSDDVTLLALTFLGPA